MASIRENLAAVQDRIRQAALDCGRDPESVRLVAVSKTHPAHRVREAVDAGATVFGESYVQEAREKIPQLADCNLSWHLVGHLQTNKAKYAVSLFDLIHSVDSLRLAREIDRQAGKIGKQQAVLIQIDLGKEPTKSGVDESEAESLIREAATLEHLRIKGLMTLPPFFDAPERARPFFRQLRLLRERIRDMGIHGISMEELSMGMTGDFEVAVQEGATLVRVGTAIFGERE